GASASATAADTPATAATAKLPRVCSSIPESEIEAATEPSGSEERILRRRSASNGETTRDGVALEPELIGCGACGRSAPGEETLDSARRCDPPGAAAGTDLLGVAGAVAFA